MPKKWMSLRMTGLERMRIQGRSISTFTGRLRNFHGQGGAGSAETYELQTTRPEQLARNTSMSAWA